MTARAVAGLALPAPSPVHIIALGKAAAAMTRGALSAIGDAGRIAGGVIVAAGAEKPPHPRLQVVVGDHPVPGRGSFAAARAIGEAAEQVRDGDIALVLLSGGTTSLAAGPVDGVRADDLPPLFSALLGSGLAIGEMNLVRKRVLRWGAGRLAVALGKATRIHCLAISDVLGNDPASIGSGPCVPDDHTVEDVRSLLRRAHLDDRVPSSVREYLDAVAAGREPETPKPGDEVFRRTEVRIIASNHTALEAAAACARELGLETTIRPEPLVGEASDAGRAMADALADAARAGRRRCLLWGGETTVTLGPDAPPGGRAQEAALAAAQRLAERDAGDAMLLVAGTDGRDGPTDAAGACVTAQTWKLLEQRGADPARALATHAAHAALDQAGALLRTGLTGTNVMDVAVGIAWGVGRQE